MPLIRIAWTKQDRNRGAEGGCEVGKPRVDTEIEVHLCQKGPRFSKPQILREVVHMLPMLRLHEVTNRLVGSDVTRSTAEANLTVLVCHEPVCSGRHAVEGPLANRVGGLGRDEHQPASRRQIGNDLGGPMGSLL